MQVGEVLRRQAFFMLDRLHGGRQAKLLKVNKREIVEGVTEAYVDRRIEAIMEHAKKNSAFYRENYADAKSLQDFPVLCKSDYVQNTEKILIDEYQGRTDELFKISTSGSTGAPFSVYYDRERLERMNMNFIAVIELVGFRFGMKRGEFRVWVPGKTTISKWRSFKNNLLMVDISNMGDDALADICDFIQKKHLQVLVSYSSALTALANYIKRKNVDVSKWDVEMVISMGEGLPQGTFDDLKSIFGFAPIRSYGNNENGWIAVDLNEEMKYTIDLYNYYIEILKLDSDEPAEPGELGRIVVTDYYNKAFPMIRYDTGDTAIYEEIHDEKGRKHAWFTEIYGRRGSLMYNCKGEPLSIHVFMNVLFQMEDVVHQAQCIQWEKKRYELLLNADRDRLDEDALVASYRKYLGEEAQIDVTYVDEIPIQASGKRMACLNKCPDYQ